MNNRVRQKRKWMHKKYYMGVWILKDAYIRYIYYLASETLRIFKMKIEPIFRKAAKELMLVNRATKESECSK